jgi:hypothetical protein
MLVIRLLLAFRRLRSGFLPRRLLRSGLRRRGLTGRLNGFWVGRLRPVLRRGVTLGGRLGSRLLCLVGFLVESLSFLSSFTHGCRNEVLVALVRSFLAG